MLLSKKNRHMYIPQLDGIVDRFQATTVLAGPNELAKFRIIWWANIEIIANTGNADRISDSNTKRLVNLRMKLTTTISTNVAALRNHLHIETKRLPHLWKDPTHHRCIQRWLRHGWYQKCEISPVAYNINPDVLALAKNATLTTKKCDIDYKKLRCVEGSLTFQRQILPRA